MSESLQARIKLNGERVYQDLIDNHYVSKAFAKKVQYVLALNRTTNFPDLLKESILKMYICTKDLKMESWPTMRNQKASDLNSMLWQNKSVSLSKKVEGRSGRQSQSRGASSRKRSRSSHRDGHGAFPQVVKGRGARKRQGNRNRNRSRGNQSLGSRAGGKSCNYCH